MSPFARFWRWLTTSRIQTAATTPAWLEDQIISELRGVDRLYPDGSNDGPWPGPGGCDPDEPCSLWDARADRPVETVCRNHQPAGRHHAPPLRYTYEPVPGKATDTPTWRRP